MGWETLAIAGFSALSANQTMREGKAASRALVAEAQINAENKAHDTVRAAGKLQNNFLNSGLTLEAGPMDIIQRAYSSGQRDVDRIVENANIRSQNKISSARTRAFEGIAKTVGGMSFGGSGSMFEDIGLTSPTKAPMAYGPQWGVNENISMTINDPANSGIF